MLTNGESVSNCEKKSTIVAMRHQGIATLVIVTTVIVGIIAERILGIENRHATKIKIQHNGKILGFVTYTKQEADINRADYIKYGFREFMIPVGLRVSMSENKVFIGTKKTIIESRTKGQESNMTRFADREFVTERC